MYDPPLLQKRYKFCFRYSHAIFGRFELETGTEEITLRMPQLTSKYEILPATVTTRVAWDMARELENPYWVHPLMMVKDMGLSLGHRSERRVNITATLPLEFLERIDELIENNTVPSRSFVIREAVKKYLKDF